MKRLRPGDLVRLEWVDSSSMARWYPIQDIADTRLLQCESVGWIVKANKRRVALAAHRTEEGEVHGVMLIPCKCIQKIRVLQQG